MSDSNIENHGTSVRSVYENLCHANNSGARVLLAILNKSTQDFFKRVEQILSMVSVSSMGHRAPPVVMRAEQ